MTRKCRVMRGSVARLARLPAQSFRLPSVPSMVCTALQPMLPDWAGNPSQSGNIDVGSGPGGGNRHPQLRWRRRSRNHHRERWKVRKTPRQLRISLTNRTGVAAKAPRFRAQGCRHLLTAVPAVKYVVDSYLFERGWTARTLRQPVTSFPETERRERDDIDKRYLPERGRDFYLYIYIYLSG